IAVLADVNEHVEGERDEQPERDERGSHAIAELDAARFGRDDCHGDERDEEVEPAPEEAPEIVQIARDRDKPVPEHAVSIVDELALDPDRLDESTETPIRETARDDPHADERRDGRRRGSDAREGRARRREAPE